MSWKSLFGGGELEELPKELSELLAQSKRDTKALQELLKRSEKAVEAVSSAERTITDAHGSEG